jgi:hypothetical protein
MVKIVRAVWIGGKYISNEFDIANTTFVAHTNVTDKYYISFQANDSVKFSYFCLLIYGSHI